MANKQTPSDVVASRVRQVRTKRGMKVADLAARCAELGAPQLTAQALYKLEGQRESATRRPRPVSVDELLALGLALRCNPVHLLVPPDDDSPYAITGTTAAPARQVREWIRGDGLLPSDDLDAEVARDYITEVPRSEWVQYGGRPVFVWRDRAKVEQALIDAVDEKALFKKVEES
jgi:hypothetical protein